MEIHKMRDIIRYCGGLELKFQLKKNKENQQHFYKMMHDIGCETSNSTSNEESFSAIKQVLEGKMSKYEALVLNILTKTETFGDQIGYDHFAEDEQKSESSF